MVRRRGGLRRTVVRDSQPSLRAGPVLSLSLVLLLGGWSALWLFARYEARATFDRWMANEHAFGRAWTCPDETVKGFPLGIVLTCDHPTFRGPVADSLFAGEIGALRAEARLYFPTNVVVTLVGPMRATEVGGTRQVGATWSKAALTLRGELPADLNRGQFWASDLHIGPTVGTGAAAADSVSIGTLDVGFKPVGRTSGSRMDLETTVSADQARIPLLDAVLGSADPLHLTFKGFATQVDFQGGSTWRDILEPWTAAGGQLHIEALDLTKGAFRMNGAGRLSLDDEHRPEGRLDAGLSGFDAVAARLGVPLGAIQVGGLVAGLLGGGANPDGAREPSDLSLPLVAKDGRLSLGPIKTGVRLDPVY